MNIIEAAHSGKPFKRPHQTYYYLFVLKDSLKIIATKIEPSYYIEKSVIVNEKGVKFFDLSIDDILAEDWEVKECQEK